MNKYTYGMQDLSDDITESTETIDAVKVGGMFEIILDIKKINTVETVFWGRENNEQR